MKLFRITAALILPCAALLVASCDKSTTTPTTTTNDSLPAGFDRFTSDVTVRLDGDYVVTETHSVPNHGSPYFETSDPRYEAYNGTNPNFMLNPNKIQSQDLVFRIPRRPAEATTHRATPLGPIGVAVNGVALFNQYAAGGNPLGPEINSFDQYNGHPQMSGMYHYHIEPLYLTRTRGSSALIGFLLDGFPVYGPQENGRTITNDDLDEFHGHVGATADYPNGIYHYHVTADAPYINGSGFYGTPGTVSQ
jgi:hypothetical protein